jgi:signal transduction histidine kinase
MPFTEFTVVLVGLIAVLIGVWAVIRANQIRRLAEVDLGRLSGGLLKMQEAERARIAGELHDDICQQLTVLALELDALHSQPPDTASELRPIITALAQRVRLVASDVQRVTRGLYPARLEYLGLVPAVQAMCRDMEHYGLRIDVSRSDWPSELPASVALSLYRVTQEAVHNAAKHSAADAVRVTFEGTDEALRLTVTDTGVGFEPQRTDGSGGIGMLSMQQRLRSIGGSLSVYSAPGQGTRIRAVLPRMTGLSTHTPPGIDTDDSTLVGAH